MNLTTESMEAMVMENAYMNMLTTKALNTAIEKIEFQDTAISQAQRQIKATNTVMLLSLGVAVFSVILGMDHASKIEKIEKDNTILAKRVEQVEAGMLALRHEVNKNKEG